jgi:hypothetical protein
LLAEAIRFVVLAVFAGALKNFEQTTQGLRDDGYGV